MLGEHTGIDIACRTTVCSPRPGVIKRHDNTLLRRVRIAVCLEPRDLTGNDNIRK